MKRVLAAGALALVGLFGGQAHALVDVDDHAHLYSEFVSGDRCVQVWAEQYAYPYATVGDAGWDIGSFVQAWVHDDAGCSSYSDYYYGSAEDGSASFVMDPTGSIALATGTLQGSSDTLDVRVRFLADTTPELNPEAGTGQQTWYYDVFHREGTTTGTFAGAATMDEIEGQGTAAWTFHWGRVG